MSDDELGEVERGDLVEAARKIYDDEVAARKREASARLGRAAATTGHQVTNHQEVEEDWLEDAAEAYSSYARPESNDPSEGAEDVRIALEADGIPCHLELVEETVENEKPRHRWRVMVPGKLIHRATSLIDRDIFNAEFEAQWRAHLEMLDDNDLRVMEPQYAFCGLFDRLERINRAYDEELQRRGIEG
jgi:hypothetical protein